jgi:DnaJ family protein C protein 11
VIYDLEGEEGVQNEYKTGGAMGQGGEGERRIGVKTMGADEFRVWFMGVLLERERRSIVELVGSTGTCKVVLNVEHLLSGSPRVGRFRPVEDVDVEVEVSGPVISAQELQFRQSFSVPLPGLGRLLLSRLPSWKQIIRSELTINNDGEDEGRRSSWEETVGPRIPKLTFSAGISGPIAETLLVRLPNDNRPEEVLPASFCLYTLRSDKIHISTRLDHSFTDTRHQEGTNSITSLMNGVDLDVTAGILPRRFLNVGVGRLFTLVEDTTPFYFHLRTLFNNSLNFKPPVLDFRISRSFGENHFGYCRWSSGDFGWPALAHMSRISPITFAKRPLWLPQGLLMSNMRIAYFWIEDRSQMIQTDDEDDINILDASDRHIEKPASLRVNSNNPSWHLTVDSSPYDTTISVTWSRDLFSRSAERPIRSRIRKSGEAVARSRDFDVPSSRGIRFEIEGNLGLDLSLGGVVRGVRRIGDFTSIGIGVGLNPERGLYMSFSWSRLGQNIIIPVILLSRDELGLKSILWALAVPWATYAAMEFGILRPRLRRRRQKLIEKTRKELRENVLRRRVEAEQANILMRPLVEHRQAIEREQGGLVIVRAEYGVRVIGSNSKPSWRPGEVADVTVALAALVDGGQLSLPRGLEKASLIGFWDPAPLRRKLLIVDYVYGGKRHHAEFSHNDALSLPMRAHEV